MPSSAEIIKRLTADGWTFQRQKGSHRTYAKPGAPDIVTVPHPERDIPTGTLRSIYRKAGWKWPPP